MVKYSPSGNVLIAKSAGGNSEENGYSLALDATDVYLTGGFLSSSIAFGSDTLYYPTGGTDPIFIVKYDTALNVICATALSSGGDDNNAITTNCTGATYIAGDFGINPFIVGSDTLILSGTENFFIAKYNCNGEPVTTNEIQNQETIILFPNPTSSTFKITSTDKIETMKLYNILGELLITEKINNTQSTINISQFSKGIYFVEIKTEKGIVRKKVVKE
jgi:hypothetical protein